MPQAISAAIPTYLRPELLTEAVPDLCHQSLPPDRYEILVAGSASHPKTKALVRRPQAEFSDHSLTWLPVPETNVAIARNIALQQADSPLIAYLDDVARASSEWLETGLSCFQNFAALDCVGGPILPFYTTPRPA